MESPSLRKYFEAAKRGGYTHAAAMISKFLGAEKAAEEPKKPEHEIPKPETEKRAEDIYKEIVGHVSTKMAGEEKETILARIEDIGAKLDSLPENEIDTIEKIKALIDSDKI